MNPNHAQPCEFRSANHKGLLPIVRLLICLPPSWSSLFGARLDWSVLNAAYRLAAIVPAMEK